MDWNRVEGNWKQMKGKIKEKWGNLTDDDLTAINGKRDQLEGKIQERYGIAKDQVRKDVDDWYETRRGNADACSGPNRHFVTTSLDTSPASAGLFLQRDQGVRLAGPRSDRSPSVLEAAHHRRSGRSPDWLKFKNPTAPVVQREAEEDWGR